MSLKSDLQKQIRENAMCIDDHLWDFIDCNDYYTKESIDEFVRVLLELAEERHELFCIKEAAGL